MNKTAKSLLKHLFYDKIVQLEVESKESMTFSKQMEIKHLNDSVELFVEKNPNSNFEVRVLEKNAENNEDYKVALSFKNYNKKDEKSFIVPPKELLVVIDNSYSSVSFYAWSIDGSFLLPL